MYTSFDMPGHVFLVVLRRSWEPAAAKEEMGHFMSKYTFMQIL